jgi:hypothetical protein
VFVILEKRIFQPPYPVLVQRAVNYSTAPIREIRKWIRRKIRDNFEFKDWPENFHELHNDLNKEEI